MKRNKQLLLGAVFAALSTTSLSTIASYKEANIQKLTNSASAVFQGEVLDIQYKDSVEGIPHTFVTYQVEEDIAGNNAGRKVTLRFIGGVKKISDTHFETLEVSHVPEFNVGSKDIVFIDAKNDGQCPLVSCSSGLFRLKDQKVFDHSGRALKLGQTIDQQPMIEALGETKNMTAINRSAKVKAKVDSLSMNQFKRLVSSQVRGKKLMPVESADISAKFKAAAIGDMASPKVPRRSSKAQQEKLIEQDVQ